jgi:hypothetical protein
MCSTHAPLRSTTLRPDHGPIAPAIKRKYPAGRSGDRPIMVDVMRQGLRPEVNRIIVDGNDQLVTRLRMRKMLRQSTNDYLEKSDEYRRFEIPAQLEANSSSGISNRKRCST